MQGVAKWVCVMQPAPQAAAEAARTARPRFLVVLYSAMPSLDLAWLCPVDHVLAALASPTSSQGCASPGRLPFDTTPASAQ
eukprot:6848375-Prymnesium_polylepis.1